MAGKLKVLTRAQIAQLSVVQNALEVLDWVLYDRLPVLNGGAATQFTFFQQAVGQSGITKDTTNLEIPGQLPAGHEFVCQKIIFEAQPNQAAGIVAAYAQDAVNLTHYGWGQFNIGSRPYLEAPLKNFIGGNLQGFTGVVTAAYAQSRTVVNGEMEYAPVIPANYSFNFQANYPLAPVVAADGFIRAQMIGKLIRPRQG
jgi:hypothetical protein